MNKKGAMTDLALYSIVAFAFIVCIGILWYVFSQANTQIIAQAPALQKAVPSINVTNLMSDTIGKSVESYSVLSWVTYLILIGMALSILITSALIKTNPFWFVAYVFVVVISVIVSAFISNSYESIISNPQVASGFTGLMGASWIMLHLPLWITVIGFVAGILLFINIDWGIQ